MPNELQNLSLGLMTGKLVYSIFDNIAQYAPDRLHERGNAESFGAKPT